MPLEIPFRTDPEVLYKAEQAVIGGETGVRGSELRENSLYFSLLAGIRLETGSPKTAPTAILSVLSWSSD
jgi:hypothetical protein